MSARALDDVYCFYHLTGTASTTSGAKSCRHLLVNHGSVQKRKVSPFPRMYDTEALKNAEVAHG
jgi:hypothetical protein